MNCGIIMGTIKRNREFYNKLLKYLLYLSFILLIFNIIYLQNSLIVFWIHNNSKYSSLALNSGNYVSRDEIDFNNIIIRPEAIRKTESNIFFIETTCCTSNERLLKTQKENTLHLNIRQACSIESAASLNENSNILILYSCPLDSQLLRSAPEEIIQIFRYRNVKLVVFEMYEYFEGSPVADLVEKKILETSKYPLEHTSDVLRLLTLWKYGGTYLDLDVISLRPISRLGTNFVGYELNDAIGSAVINFEEKGIGFNLLTQMLNHLNTKFHATHWSKNGPDLLTQTLLNLCKDVQVIEEYDRQICDGFTLYKRKLFYPVAWNKWRYFFNETDIRSFEERFKESYFVHLWNKHTYRVKVFVGSQQPYEILANRCCQLVHTQLQLRYFVVF